MKRIMSILLAVMTICLCLSAASAETKTAVFDWNSPLSTAIDGQSNSFAKDDITLTFYSLGKISSSTWGSSIMIPNWNSIAVPFKVTCADGYRILAVETMCGGVFSIECYGFQTYYNGGVMQNSFQAKFDDTSVTATTNNFSNNGIETFTAKDGMNATAFTLNAFTLNGGGSSWMACLRRVVVTYEEIPTAPSTGDSTPVMLLAAGLVLSAAVVVLLRRRKAA